MSKRLLRTVDLRFFCDDANGEWGLAHADTIDDSNGDGFNAFWGGTGIFHDVFEHAHEFVHKYFRGNAAMNMGGEVAAMGALWFYYSEANMFKRLNTSYRSAEEITLNSTLYDMQEGITDYCRYGGELVCDVPKQRKTDNLQLEDMIREHYRQIRETSHRDNEYPEQGWHYKKSVTFSKLARLYRYGFRMAQRLMGQKYWMGEDTLISFMDYWNRFCKTNDAETLANLYRGITFKLYRLTGGGIGWTATLNPIDAGEVKRVKITDGNFIPDEIDFYA